MDVRTAIANSYLARGFSSEFVDALVAISVEEHFPAGKAIIEENDESRDLMILVSGKAEIFKAGHEYIGAIRPGLPFGEVAFLDGKPRSSSVIASEACVVVRIIAEKLEAALQASPDMAMVALRNLALVLCNRLRLANQEIAALHVEDEFGF